MKHLLFNLILACMAFFAVTPAYADNVQMNGDTIIAISGTDTVRLSTKSLGSVLSGIVDDTVAGKGSDVESFSADDQAAEVAAQREYYAKQDQAERKLVVVITSIICGTIVLVLLAVLCFWYMHRKVKYRMMERAIDNNYPLYQQGVPQPQYVYQPNPQPQPSQSAQQPQQQSIGNQFLNDQINYNTKQFKSAFVMIVVGVALGGAFLCESAFFMTCVMLIVALLGAGKFALAYQEQRAFIQAQQQRDAWGQQQQQPQPPQFDPNNNNSQQQPQA